MDDKTNGALNLNRLNGIFVSFHQASGIAGKLSYLFKNFTDLAEGRQLAPPQLVLIPFS